MCNNFRTSILLVLCLCFHAANAQTWTLKQPIPGTPSGGRWGAICFSLGNKIYVGGGYTGNFVSVNDFWEYDPAVNQWTKKKNLPGSPNRTAGIGFSANGKGYIGLGSVNYNTISAAFLNDLWEYDPNLDTWTQKSPLPDSGRHHAACFVVGDKAYVVGGNTGYPYIASNDLWEYDAAGDIWTEKMSYPASHIHSAMAFAINDKGYVVGGNVKGIGASGNGDADSATYQYNTATDTWQKKSDYCNRRESGVGFAIDGIGYVGFGSATFPNNTTYYEEFCKFDPVADVWSTTTSFPNIARAYAIAAVVNNKAYAGGGWLYVTSEMYQNDWGELSVPGIHVPSISSEKFRVYPNPACNQVIITANNHGQAILYDIYGRPVKSIDFEESIASIIDVSDLPNGVYSLITVAGANSFRSLVTIKH